MMTSKTDGQVKIIILPIWQLPFAQFVIQRSKRFSAIFHRNSGMRAKNLYMAKGGEGGG